MPQRPPVPPQAQDVQPNSAKRSAANPWCWPMGLWWLVIILEGSPMGCPCAIGKGLALWPASSTSSLPLPSCTASSPNLDCPSFGSFFWGYSYKIEKAHHGLIKLCSARFLINVRIPLEKFRLSRGLLFWVYLGWIVCSYNFRNIEINFVYHQQRRLLIDYLPLIHHFY